MKHLIVSLLLLGSLHGMAQMENPATWAFFISKANPQPGDEIEVLFEAEIDPVWYLYSLGFDADCGPIPTTFEWKTDPSYTLIGDVRAVGDKAKFDEVFQCDIRMFTGKAQFVQKVKVNDPAFTLQGEIAYQACKENGLCVYLDQKIGVTGTAPVKKLATPKPKEEKKPAKKPEKQSPARTEYTPDKELTHLEKRRQNLKRDMDNDRETVREFIDQYNRK